MNQLYTRRNIFISLTISLAVVSFFVWYTFRNMKKAGYESRIVHTRLQSLRAMEDLMDDMQDIETGNRGYVISGDNQFLEPYYSALRDLNQDTVLLKALYPIFPQRKTTLEGLLNLIKRKAEFSMSSVDRLNNSKQDSAFAQVQPGEGRQIMDSIRQIVLLLENEDRKVLQYSNSQREVAAATTAKLFGILAGILISILIVLFLRIRSDLKRRDINERKISYLAEIVEQAGDAIMSADTDFNIVSWNKGAEEMYGYSKEEAIGKKYHLLLGSRKSDSERQEIVEILKSIGYYAGEIEYIRMNGQSIFVQAFFTLLRDKSNQIAGCSIVHRDFTEKRKAEKILLEFNEKLNIQVQEKTFEIKELLERFKIVAKATNDVVWDADLKNGSVWWNNNFIEKFGYKINDETSSLHFWDDHVHHEDKDRVVGHIDYVLNRTKANVWSNEYRFAKADGSYVNIYDRSYVMRDENGNAYRMIGSMADVTDLFIAREELKQSEERYRSLIEQASDSILIYSFDGKILNFNISAASFMGYTMEEFSRFDLKDILIGDIIIDSIKYAEILAGNAVTLYRQFKRKDGSLIEMEVTAKILSDGNVLAFGRDVTERKKAEEALRKSELYLRGTLDATNDGILTIDNTGKVINANYRFAELWHIPDEILDRKDDNALLEYVLNQLSDPDAFISKVKELYKSDKTDFDILHFRDKRIFERYSTPLMLNKSIVGRVWSFRNITERKKAEINQQRQFDELQQLYNLSVLIDRENNIEKIYNHAIDSLLSGVKADRCSIFLFDKEGVMQCKASKGLSSKYILAAEGHSPWKADTAKAAPIFIEDVAQAPELETLRDVILNEGIRSLGFIPLVFHGKLIGKFMIYYNTVHVFTDNEAQFTKTVAHNIAFSVERNRSNEALQASENRYHSLVEQAADAIALFDNKGKILEVNNSALQLLGYKYGELMNMSLSDILTKEEIMNSPVQYDLLGKGLSTIKQRKMRRKDGSIVITEVNSKILPDGRFLSMVRDLTDRIEAQKQIEREKELSDKIIDSLPGVFYFFDKNGKFIRWNKQLEIVTGYNSKEISAMHPIQFFLGEGAKYIGQRIAKVFSEGISDAETDLISKDGSSRPYYFKAILIDFDGKSCLLGTGIDISDRKKAEKELSDSYKSIRKLTSHLQNVREEDRAHIAREIHDELGQQLTVLKMDVSWVNKKIGTTDDVIKQKMKGLLTMLDETVKTVRRISSELRPSLLDDLGLTAAMEWQLHEFKKRSDIKISFTAPETEMKLPDMIKIGVFRIFQESLTNVVRHSGAKNLKVRLEHKDDNLILTIDDNGKGFDKEKIADKRTLGILGMKERTSMIGGSYEITSTPGNGTVVVVAIPINGQN